MNVRGDILVMKTMNEVEEWARTHAAMVPFPFHKRLTYYVSQDGILYACNRVRMSGQYLIYQERPKESIVSGQGIFYHMMRDGSQHSVSAARLVYFTYVLGYWDDSVHIVFKDGNCEHVHPDNLVEREKPLNVERMRLLADLYAREFRKIAHEVQWALNIDMEDAKDATQDAFLSLCTKCDDEKIPYFGAKWMVMAKKYGMLAHDRVLLNEDINGSYDIECSLDILKNLTEPQRQVIIMTADGMSLREIAEELGIAHTTVRRRLDDARAIMKNYLSTDSMYSSNCRIQ